MRKIVSILLALLLLAALAFQTLAVEVVSPDAPVIVSEPEDQTPYFDQLVTLTVNATCEVGAELTYQWYVADAPEEGRLRIIEGAESNSYTLAFTEDDIGATKYYRLAIYANAGGVKSEMTASRYICVTVKSVGYKIAILQKPTKLEYTQGETLDLTGLRVRIFTENDSYFDSVDGEGLEITKEPLTTVGQQKIAIYYGVLEPEFFTVTVRAPEKHEHSFPEGWVITTQATCKEEGIRVRECECGYTEREAIPKTEHHWDQGQKKDGFTVYTCTVCGETRKEGTGAVTLPTASPEQTKPQESETGESEQPTEPTQPTQSDHQSTTVAFRSPWKTAAILIAALLVCGIAAVAVLMVIRSRK